MKPRAFAIAATIVLASGCAPRPNEGAGLTRYSTDVVLGAQTKDVPPPPVSTAELAPAFPSFIVPSPPPAQEAGPVLVPSAPPPTQAVPPARACRQADVRTVPRPAAVDVSDPPVPGVYPFRQKGSYKVGSAEAKPLPEHVDRVLKNVVRKGDGTFSYDIEITQLGSTTTTSYAVVRAPGASQANGIYVTKTVMKLASGSIRSFEPAPPGLEMFSLPAQAAAPWRSVATDPIHGTSASLDGVITSPARVDACGDLVEGWEAKVTISTNAADGPDSSRSSTISATYVVVPQLGGLIVADRVSLTGTEGSMTAPTPVAQDTDVIIDRLTPVRR